MLGAIAGDIIGSVYEGQPITTTDFPLFDPHCRFTDDTVLTVAVADAILAGADYGEKFREWYRYYPERGYGPGFRRWAASERAWLHDSAGNGSAMRVSPIGWAFNSLDDVLREARLSAMPSHNHPEGIKGAQAVAAAVYMARSGAARGEIRGYLEETFGYGLNETLEYIREHNRPSAVCARSVPQAVTAFLLSDSFEDAVRKAVSMGGDADTVACMAGGIAEAFYRSVPDAIAERIDMILDTRMKNVIARFRKRLLQCPV
jgi:ADP-ribosylglycohydrolase